ncbi:mobile mystery protein B [Devosia sp. A449]
MTDIFAGPEGSTPLAPEDQKGLRQSWIITRQDLNAAEQANILAGRAWALRSRMALTSEPYLARLHQRMFGEVWSWAGKWRRVETNIGALAHDIPVRLRQFLDDMDYWLAHNTYGPDELATRFHHGLVSIHPFTNGNGRHTRLAADLLCRQLGVEAFTWGRHSIDLPSATRQAYLAALRAADQHDFAPLLAFVRS